jgi:hypothetical protein
MTVLQGTPVWFLLFIIFIMGAMLTAFGGYCTWSIKNIFTDLKGSIMDLKELIAKLFDKHDDHEARLSHLEGKCMNRRCSDAEYIKPE